jgi:hypothetical protein
MAKSNRDKPRSYCGELGGWAVSMLLAKGRPNFEDVPKIREYRKLQVQVGATQG